MKIEGRYIFHLPIEEVYEALRDEALLRQALPGHVYFRMTSPTDYEGAMELTVPKFGGHYSGQLEVTETIFPTFYRLRALGSGMGRQITAEGTVTLTELEGERTEVHYLGSTDAFDHLNRLFQMAASPIATTLANRGLQHLERVIHARKQPPVPPEQEAHA